MQHKSLKEEPPIIGQKSLFNKTQGKNMKPRHNLLYLLLAIGLTTVGQLPAGIYLPSLVEISAWFHLSPAAAQYIVGLYLLSYGMSQLIYGPLSDHYGRKPAALFGLYTARQ